ALRGADGILHTEQVRLGDLPETKFWEQDKVRVRLPHDGGEHEMVVCSIDYCRMYDRCDNGSPWPFYNLQYMDAGRIGAEESWIELIERGNVWKYHNNQPLSFIDLKEEASFFQLVGQTEEVRNPKNSLYSWTRKEVLDAIESGIVHGFSISSGFFGSRPQISAR